MNRFNHFTPETKKSYEQLGLALAIFMKCKDQTETLLVSDGLCQLYHLKRKELMAYFNGAAADEHYSLTKKRVEVLVNQLLGADRQTITVRVKINNFYHTLLLHAKRQRLADELENVLAYVFGLKAQLAKTGKNHNEYKRMLRSVIMTVSYKVYLDKYFSEITPENK